MEAWKLRALVYGLLVVVAGLVLAQRATMDAAGSPDAHVLRGHTGQGAAVRFDMGSKGLESFAIESIALRCPGGRRWRTSWTPSVGQANVTMLSRGSSFQVEESNGSFAWLGGTVHDGGHAVSGTFRVTLAGGCFSGRVRFSARD